jgi:hypothetical protein
MFARLIRVCASAAVGAAIIGPVHAVPIVYNTDASFLAAAGGGLTFEGFETAVEGTPGLVTFPGGTFSCAGTAFCSLAFGLAPGSGDTSAQSIFFSSPDTATFTFGAAIIAFGIAIGGAGDVAPITLTASLSNGDTALALNNYTGPCTGVDIFAGNRQFFGVTDTVPFTSVTFTASNSGDSIFFDTMHYGLAAAAVPEPGTLALLATALLGVGFLGRSTRRR